MEIVDVVRKLVGPIEPIGSHGVDNLRYENMERMIEIVDTLLSDISDVIPNKNRDEASMKKAGERADEFFNALGIEE